MEDNTLVKSSFSATIHVPIEKVDIPSWCFGLSESEYQACSPAHVSAGATTSPGHRTASRHSPIDSSRSGFTRRVLTP
jgi:hypothetical protein